MSQPEVKLEYEYTEAEYLAANRLFLSSSPHIIARLAVFGLLLGAGVILLSFLTDSLMVIPGLVFVVLLEAALFYNVLVNTPRKYFRGDAKFRDRYQITFSDGGVKLRLHRLIRKWPGVFTPEWWRDEICTFCFMEKTHE